MKNKLIFAGVVGVGVLVAGTYLSGFVTLMLLKLNTGLLAWHTYPDYFRALDLPQFQPFASRIRLGGYIGYGVPSVAYLALVAMILKPAKKSMHGDARFANIVDLQQKGLLKAPSNGIVVGRFGGKLLRLGGQQFVILAAPTRSGKGVGIVIPNLLEYQESMVVLDIKQENFDLTSGWRAQQGQEIFLFNPFAEDRRTHRWNPLSYVSRDPAFRVSDLMSIAAMLYPDGADDQKFWVSQAGNAFMAFFAVPVRIVRGGGACGLPVCHEANIGRDLPSLLGRRQERTQGVPPGPGAEAVPQWQRTLGVRQSAFAGR